MKNKSKIFLLTFLLSFSLVFTAVLATDIPGTWYGYAHLNGTAVSRGTLIKAYLNNGTTATSQPIKTGCDINGNSDYTKDAAYYIIHIEGTTSNYVRFTISGFNTTNADQTWGLGWHELNLTGTNVTTTTTISAYPATVTVHVGDRVSLVSGNTFVLSGITSTGITASINPTVSLSTGGSQNYDSDSNGVYDLNITLDSIASDLSTATLTFRSASGNVCLGTTASCAYSSGSCSVCGSGYTCTNYVCVATGSTGGGGGGSVTSEAKVESKETVSTITPETPAVVKVSETKADTLKVQEIQLDVKETVSNVEVKVTEASKPAAAEAPISSAVGGTYNYISISTTVAAEKVEKAKIKFKVEKKWILDNDYDEKTVALNRYSKGKWEKLKTVFSNSDAKYYYYEAETEGFSTFAITAEKKSVSKVCSPNDKRCAGNNLEQCKSDGSGWTAEACEFGCDSETKKCKEKACVESWECAEWGECLKGGKQTRTCADKNACGTTASKPAEEQECKYIQPTNWTLIIIIAVALAAAGWYANKKGYFKNLFAKKKIKK